MRRTFAFENGMIGKVTVGGRGTVELGFFELAVNGRKFVCRKCYQEDYENWLNKFKNEVVETTFLYSLKELHGKGCDGKCRKERREKFPGLPCKAVWYNCTVKATKDEACSAFQDKVDRLNAVVGILGRVYCKALDRINEKVMEPKIDLENGVAHFTSLSEANRIHSSAW